MKCLRILVVAGLVAGLGAGCAAFRISVDEQDPEAGAPLTARFDQRDLLRWSEEISNDLLSAPFPPEGEDKPIVVPLGIENRTRTHLDTKALSDTIGTRLLDSGDVRLVNAARRDSLLKEQGYQLENCTPETRVKIGRQLGAKYMLTGSLTEIAHRSGRQARVSKKEDIYYQLTVELTDLETGLIAVRKQRDRLRRASKPLIGW